MTLEINKHNRSNELSFLGQTNQFPLVVLFWDSFLLSLSNSENRAVLEKKNHDYKGWSLVTCLYSHDIILVLFQ